MSFLVDIRRQSLAWEAASIDSGAISIRYRRPSRARQAMSTSSAYFTSTSARLRHQTFPQSRSPPSSTPPHAASAGSGRKRGKSGGFREDHPVSCAASRQGLWFVDLMGPKVCVRAAILSLHELNENTYHNGTCCNRATHLTPDQIGLSCPLINSTGREIPRMGFQNGGEDLDSCRRQQRGDRLENATRAVFNRQLGRQF